MNHLYLRIRAAVSSAIVVAFMLIISVNPLSAQSGSPIQAEYASAPVPAGPSVNEYTGDFTYGLPLMTIPGPNGSSYTISLSYRAGASPEADVSWVGYGWSLNPGAIIRNKKGFPDDWYGKITYHRKTPPVYTVTGRYGGNLEIAGIDNALGPIPVAPGISGTVNMMYNSVTGYSKYWDITAGLTSLGNFAGISFQNNNGSGSIKGVASINLFTTGAGLGAIAGGGVISSNKDDQTKTIDLNFDKIKSRVSGSVLGTASTGNLLSTQFKLSPQSNNKLSPLSKSYNEAFKLQVSPTSFIISGTEIGISGNVTKIYNEPIQIFDALGYLHSDKFYENTRAIMDFGYENDGEFDLNHHSTPIPFSNADNFTVVGGGSFRAYSTSGGGFYQNRLENSIQIHNYEATINVILLGAGARVGSGSMDYTSSSMFSPVNVVPKFASNIDEPWVWRFKNDLGGSMIFDDDDEPVHGGVDGSLHGNPPLPSFVAITDDLSLRETKNGRIGRNAIISSRTNREIEESRLSDVTGSSGAVYLKSNTRDDVTRDFVSDRSEMPDAIGEFTILGTGGAKYVYGLPVYAKDEESIALGLKNISLDNPENIGYNYLVYRAVDKSSAETVIGQEMKDPYVVAWLLTSIVTPDYVDMTGDGPTEDDLGGWTKFNYSRPSGTNSKSNDNLGSRWMLWRNPYRGLMYNPGDLSDPKDDMGSYQGGKREIYYLKSIETKTHRAVFVLNSGIRNDGKYQTSDPGSGVIAADSNYSNAPYPVSLVAYNRRMANRFLTKIELYIKNSDGSNGELLSTVNMDYDYSLRPNMPNSYPIDEESSERHGMLTLRKVWSEAKDVRKADVYPYVFGYTYRASTDYATEIANTYPNIVSYGDNYSSSAQNPEYSPYDLDRWGQIQKNGPSRLGVMNQWVSQKDDNTFDPAAWQLKTVTLPTGAEMQIHYEQDEYSYVQDRPAMAMVTLKESITGLASTLESYDGDNKTNNLFYLNLDDLDIDQTDEAEVYKVKIAIDRYLKTNPKLLFKFLYALVGTTPSLTNPEYTTSYIEGYANAYAVNVVPLDVGTASERYELSIRFGDDDEEYCTPKRVCWEFVKKRKQGKLQPNDAIPLTSDPAEMMMAALDFPSLMDIENDACKEIDYANSYIRIPMTYPKKGGGTRVKRLLTYDKGIRGKAPTLYGTEYKYEVFDDRKGEMISSGVAANEPLTGRSENALVEFINKTGYSDLDGKAISGDDRLRNEGPIGEPLLPSAYIEYSRIVKHPIHQGATAIGFSVTDFYTHRDYPYDKLYDPTTYEYSTTDPNIPMGEVALVSSVNQSPIVKDEDRTPFYLQAFPIFSRVDHSVNVSQHHSFIQSSMAGRFKRALSCKGAYTQDQDNWAIASSSEVNYFQPGEKIPLKRGIGEPIEYGNPGKEMEIVFGTRYSAAEIDDWYIEGDAGWFMLNAVGKYAVNNSYLRSMVTNKVTSYPAIVKSVESYADGNYNYTENVAFDPRTGGPAVTRSYDGFHGNTLGANISPHNGTYHSYSVNALEDYPEFESKAVNDKAVITPTNGIVIEKLFQSNEPYILFRYGFNPVYDYAGIGKLSSGDIIKVTVADPQSQTGETLDGGVYTVDEVMYSSVLLKPAAKYNLANDPSLDVEGSVTSIEVLQSGKIGSPGASLSGVVTYGESLDDVENAANVGWDGAQYINDRLDFVALLNTTLNGDTAQIDINNVSPNLKFRTTYSGSCDVMSSFASQGQVLEITTEPDDNIITVNVFGSKYSFTHKGEGGVFKLDNHGQIRFRVNGDYGIDARVWNLTFCDDSNAVRTMEGVIASSAGTITDINDYDGLGLDVQDAAGRNDYERGARGRWSMVSPYAFKKPVVSSSKAITGERVYDAAGTYNEFELFDPTIGHDDDSWFSLGEVGLKNEHNLPIESKSMLGIPSTVKFSCLENSSASQTYKNLPELVAWNAQQTSVDFESFECFEEGDLSGAVVSSTAHTGKNSLELTTALQGYTISRIELDEQIKNEGLVVHLWAKLLPAPTAILSVTIDDQTSAYPGTKIATVGEWALYEYIITTEYFNETPTPTFAIGDVLNINVLNTPYATSFIDDFKVQPLNSSVVSVVYDRNDYRTLATFDDDHFSIRPVIDAEGRPFASIVETARGMKTVGDSYAHIPAMARSYDPNTSASQAPGSASQSFSRMSGGLGNSVDNTGRSSSTPLMDAQFDILNVEITPDKQELKVFGVDPSELYDVIQDKIGTFQSLSKNELNLLGKFEKVQARYNQVQAGLEHAKTDAERAEKQEELDALMQEQSTLLKALGLNDEDIRHIKKEIDQKSEQK